MRFDNLAPLPTLPEEDTTTSEAEHDAALALLQEYVVEEGIEELWLRGAVSNAELVACYEKCRDRVDENLKTRLAEKARAS